MRIKQKPQSQLNLTEIKKELAKLREEGDKIISHYKRLNIEYDDWQDRFYALDKAINIAETEKGIGIQEQKEYNILGELGV